MLLMVNEAWSNEVTMAYVLSACASLPSLKHAKCTHALVDTYAQHNSLRLMELIVESGSRWTETWNAAISAVIIIEGDIRKLQSGLSG
jgi:hypothetical protein